jgi:hypothetical protein
MTRMLKISLLSMITALLASCASDPPQDPAAVRRELSAKVDSADGLSVLFVGNSYSFHVPKSFAKVARQREIKVAVDQSTHGGWTLARHAASEETLAKIRSRNWDVIVLQEQSRIPSLPAMRALRMAPAVKTLAAAAREQGAVPVLYQTWGYRDGDPLVSGDDFFKMNRRVRKGYLATAGDAGGLLVVPAGDAWERDFDADLFMADGSHPSGKGNLLTATVFADTILGVPDVQPAPKMRSMRLSAGSPSGAGG